MHDEALLKAHLDILEAVHGAERSVSQLAEILQKSVSWTSGCVSDLVRMDLVTKRREGLIVLVGLASNDMAQSLAVLLLEGPIIDLSKVLDRAGLKILPVLLDPGATTEEASLRTGLSKPTIRARLRRWAGMGIVMKGKRTKHYVMHPSQVMLRSFIVRYSQWRNRRALRELVPDGLIIWQWRDEYLFSTMNRMLPPDCLSAGLTRLEELGYDLILDREYYLHSPAITRVGEEEALVQSLRVDPNNPRIPRFIKEGVLDRGANPMRILEFGKKYGLKTRLRTVVGRLG